MANAYNHPQSKVVGSLTANLAWNLKFILAPTRISRALRARNERRKGALLENGRKSERKAKRFWQVNNIELRRRAYGPVLELANIWEEERVCGNESVSGRPG